MKDFSLLIDFYMNKSLENKDIFYNYVGGSSRLLFNRVSIITMFMLILDYNYVYAYSWLHKSIFNFS